jgi:hypothetical protein
MKVCKTCHEEKDSLEFYTRNLSCKSCCHVKAKAWALANTDKVKESRRKTKLKQKYGITTDKYDSMFIEQNGVCAICKETHERRALNVDHCHRTNQIRDLLCDRCNLVLGLVKDDTSLLDIMSKYLNQHWEKQN